MTSAQAPAVPSYILRGHNAAVHALHFFAENAFLASGDSDGWIIIWSLTSKRPAAVWKAHDGGVMAIKDWERTRLISHGRDHKLRVWQCNNDNLRHMSTTLPVDGASVDQPQPWLLHALSINALNFCAFDIRPQQHDLETDDSITGPCLLVAGNGLDQGGIDVFQLPSERRIMQVASRAEDKMGMVMSLGLFWAAATHHLTLAAGYEDGSVILQRLVEKDGESKQWQRLATCRPHSQPVLSLDISPDRTYLLTSSADAVIAKIKIPSSCVTGDQAEIVLEKAVNTKHAGQQDLRIRPDGKICATAGWDKRVRVYSTTTMRELAVLKWHKDGCYSIAFADPCISHDRSSNTEEVQETGNAVTRNALDIIKHNRELKAKKTHWLAVGSKDCKISLWDIY